MKCMPPSFFQIDVASSRHPGVPTLSGNGFASKDIFCPSCGTRHSELHGVGHYDVIGGTGFPDFIGTSIGYPSFVVSQRVVDGLACVLASGYELLPVQFGKVCNDLLSSGECKNYYYIKALGSVQIDWAASGVMGHDRCCVCGANGSGGAAYLPRRFVPRMSTWDGSDIVKFGMSRAHWGMLFCTRKVIEIARRDSWSNLKVLPMDIINDHAAGWAGVDYLAGIWPPENWYPPSPSEGRSLSEWLGLIADDDLDIRRDAQIAVADIAEGSPEEVVPSLCQGLGHANYQYRVACAGLLLSVSFVHEISRDIFLKSCPYLSSEEVISWEKRLESNNQ